MRFIQMLQKILLTGASGNIGKQLIPLLGPITKSLRLNDISPIQPSSSNAEVMIGDLADSRTVDAMVDGCDALIHLGGISSEQSWAKIRPANIDGIYNLYEAARRFGKPRIILASSHHVVGFHRRDTRIDNAATLRPDRLYGVSKCFGEAMASMYFDKFGIETAVVRIGSLAPEPRGRRMLSTWFSIGDFARLIKRCLTVQHLGCAVIYGVSDNHSSWWDNSPTNWLGWQPQDSSTPYREALEAEEPTPDANDPAVRFQGGKFTTDPIFAEEKTQ